jgi:hypothetical protein
MGATQQVLLAGAGSSGPLSVFPGAGLITIAGLVPAAIATRPAIPGAGSITITGQTPGVAIGVPGPVWTQDNLLTSASWRGAAFGQDGSGHTRIVATGLNGATNVVNYSDDYGHTWVAAAAPPTGWTPVTNCLAYGGGVWVSGGDFINYGTSTNGSVWTNRTHTSFAMGALWFGQNNFVVIGTGVTTAKTSSDGLTWTSRTLGGTLSTGLVIGVGDSSGHHVIGGISTSAPFVSSDDGVTWSAGGTLPGSFATNGLTGLGAAGGGAFVGLSSSVTDSVVFSTDNGATWNVCATALGGFLPSSTTWSSVIYSNGRWLLFSSANSANNGVVMASVDGSHWVQASNQVPWSGALNWSIPALTGVATDKVSRYVILGQNASAQTIIQRGRDDGGTAVIAPGAGTITITGQTPTRVP